MLSRRILGYEASIYQQILYVLGKDGFCVRAFKKLTGGDLVGSSFADIFVLGVVGRNQPKPVARKKVDATR